MRIKIVKNIVENLSLKYEGKLDQHHWLKEEFISSIANSDNERAIEILRKCEFDQTEMENFAREIQEKAWVNPKATMI